MIDGRRSKPGRQRRKSARDPTRHFHGGPGRARRRAGAGVDILTLLCKVNVMNADWAAENLQTIRTLMERSALYRRALAPIMLTAGCMGLGAALLGFQLGIVDPVPFVRYWLAVAAVTCAVAFLLVRRQAIAAREPVWSPPARRVIQAAAPPLAAGLFVGLTLLYMLPFIAREQPRLEGVIGRIWLPLGWVLLYGFALHASGFFLPRGMKWLGWTFVLGACLLFAAGFPDLPRGMYSHGIMGLFFGLLQQAYGVYLYLTEPKESAA